MSTVSRVTAGNRHVAQHLHRLEPCILCEVQRDRLCESAEIGDAEHRLTQSVALVQIAKISKNLAVRRIQKRERPAAKHLEQLAQRNHVARPVQQARLIALLRFDVHHLVAVDWVHHHRQIEPRRIAFRKARIAIRGPLHRRAHAIAVAEIDVVAHPDLVAVVQNRCAGKAEQQRIQQLDAASIVVDQRSEPAPNADIDAHARIGRIGKIHVVALVVGHHLQRQLIVIAQKESPLAVVGNGRRLRHDVGDRAADPPGEAPCRCAASAENGTPCGTRRHRQSRGARPPATGWLPRESTGCA